MKKAVLLCLLLFLSVVCWSQDEDSLDPFDFEEAEEVEEPAKSKQEKSKEKDEEDDEGLDPSDLEEIESETPKEEPEKIQNEKETSEETSEPEDEEDDEGDEEDSASGITTDTERGTQSIIISGTLGIGYIYREDLFADAVLGAGTTNLDGDFFDPRVTLRFDITLKNNIQAVLELHNEARVNQLFQTSLGSIHITNRQENNNAFNFEFERAYIEVNDFFKEGLTFKAGIIPKSYDLRGNGEAFFLDLGEAESPFGDAEDINARGVLVTLNPDFFKQVPVDLYLDVFHFVTSETGFVRQDQSITGINIDLQLDKEIEGKEGGLYTLHRFFNLMFAAIQGDNQQPIWSIGFGYHYTLGGNPDKYLVNLYGEAVFQFGDFAREGLAPAFTNKDQAHLAFGGYLGLRFNYNAWGNYKPFFDVSFWYISGDDDDPNADKNRDLVTFEDVDGAAIVEENDYGFDIDSNYWAVKFQTGLSLAPILEEEVRLELLYAHFERIDAPQGGSKRIGEEIDLRITWEYSPDLTFALVAGLLFNSPFFDDVFDEVGARGKQHVFLLRFETLLRF